MAAFTYDDKSNLAAKCVKKVLLIEVPGHISKTGLNAMVCGFRMDYAIVWAFNPKDKNNPIEREYSWPAVARHVELGINFKY